MSCVVICMGLIKIRRLDGHTKIVRCVCVCIMLELLRRRLCALVVSKNFFGYYIEYKYTEKLTKNTTQKSSSVH